MCWTNMLLGPRSNLEWDFTRSESLLFRSPLFNPMAYPGGHQEIDKRPQGT